MNLVASLWAGSVSAALALATGSLAVPPATLPNRGGDDDAQTPQEHRQEALEAIAKLKAQLPVAEPSRMSDLLAARLENGFLLVELKDPPQDSPLLVPLQGEDEAVVRLTIARPPRNVPEVSSPPSQRFNMILNRVGGEGENAVYTKVHLFVGPVPGKVHASMERILDDGTYESVQLVQLEAGLEAEQIVTLYLQRYDDPAAEDAYAPIQANSFADLARREPELFEAFVQPMLRELGIGEVLGGSVKGLAIQAFLADLPVSHETRARVEVLVAQLDAVEFDEREAAQAELEKLGREAASSLAKLATTRELSLEQQTRIRAVIARFEKVDQRQIEARLADPQFLHEVAQLDGDAESKSLAELARQRLEELGETEATTKPE